MFPKSVFSRLWRIFNAGYDYEVTFIGKNLNLFLLKENMHQVFSVGGATVEVCEVLSKPNDELGGTFTLNIGGLTTSPIPHGATEEDVKLAFEEVLPADAVIVACKAVGTHVGCSFFTITIRSDVNSGAPLRITADGTMLTGTGADVAVCETGNRTGVCSTRIPVDERQLEKQFPIANSESIAENKIVEENTPKVGTVDGGHLCWLVLTAC